MAGSPLNFYEDYFTEEGARLIDIPHPHLVKLYELGFEVGNRVGRGAYGAVHVGQFGPQSHLLRGVKFAVKVQIPTRNLDPIDEARIMVHLNHRHCVRIYHVLHFDTTPWLSGNFVRGLPKPENRIYIFMEYADYDALTVLREFPNNKTDMATLWTWCGQLAAALLYLHTEGFVHRDLHQGNILFFKNPTTNTIDVKISDFGLAQLFVGVDPSDAQFRRVMYRDIEKLGDIYRFLGVHSVEGDEIRWGTHAISKVITQMEQIASRATSGYPYMTLPEIVNFFGYQP